MKKQEVHTEYSGELQDAEKNQETMKEMEVLKQQNQQLAIENYMNSLTDEKTFRLELLQTLSKISLSLEELNKTILEGLYQESEESSSDDSEETIEDVKAPEEDNNAEVEEDEVETIEDAQVTEIKK